MAMSPGIHNLGGGVDSGGAEHTPGPWKIYRASNGAMLGIGVDRPADEDHAMGVTDAYGGLWGDGGEKEANARLIASAPDLHRLLTKSLCTLQALVSNMEESGEGGTFDLEALKTLVGEIEEVRGRAA
jgi:hypothetical protein